MQKKIDLAIYKLYEAIRISEEKQEMKIELITQDWALVNTFLRETDLGDIRRICSKYCIEDQAQGIDHALWNLYQEIRKELQKEEEIKIAEKEISDNLQKAIKKIEMEREVYRNEY